VLEVVEEDEMEGVLVKRITPTIAATTKTTMSATAAVEIAKFVFPIAVNLKKCNILKSFCTW
jgi:hypothetical protein